MLSFEKTDRPVTYLITDGTLTDENYPLSSARTIKVIEAAISSAVSLVQIREKLLSARMACELARSVIRSARSSSTKIIINDRADIASAVGADGVQLTESSLPAAAVRGRFPDLIVGVSTHSPGSVAAAARAGADFALFGPVFATPGKTAEQGIDGLRAASEAAGDFPVIAIGGIDRTNLTAALDAGARGIAAIRFLNDMDNLRNIQSIISDRI